MKSTCEPRLLEMTAIHREDEEAEPIRADITIPAELISDPEMSPVRIVLWLVVSALCGGRETTTASIEQIAEAYGCGYQAARVQLAEIERAGWIERRIGRTYEVRPLFYKAGS